MISSNKDSKVQTIITWLTNEPAIGRIYYQKGVLKTFGESAEKTLFDNNYTKKHAVVTTKFDPGLVYSFKIESIDSGGNTTFSKTFTILAPTQKETIFQVIIKNLEQTFGWLSKIGF